MNPATQVSPHAPVAGDTSATSVTWSADQSIAVPSVSPKHSAIAARNHANAGTRPPPSAPTAATVGVCGVTRQA